MAFSEVIPYTVRILSSFKREPSLKTRDWEIIVRIGTLVSFCISCGNQAYHLSDLMEREIEIQE